MAESVHIRPFAPFSLNARYQFANLQWHGVGFPLWVGRSTCPPKSTGMVLYCCSPCHWLTAFFRSMARTDPMRRVTSHSMFTLSEKVITDSILLLSRHSIIPPWIDLDPLEDAPPVNNYTPRERQEEEEEELLILRQSSLCALNGLFARLVDPNQSENFG